MKRLWMLVVATVLVVPNLGYSDTHHTGKPKNPTAVEKPEDQSVPATPQSGITADKKDPCADFREGTSRNK